MFDVHSLNDDELLQFIEDFINALEKLEGVGKC